MKAAQDILIFFNFTIFQGLTRYLIFITVLNCLTVAIAQKMKIFKIDLFKQCWLDYFG